MKMTILCAGALLFSAVLTAAPADNPPASPPLEAGIFAVTDPIPGHPGVTFDDILSQVPGVGGSADKAVTSIDLDDLASAVGDHEVSTFKDGKFVAVVNAGAVELHRCRLWTAQHLSLTPQDDRSSPYRAVTVTIDEETTAAPAADDANQYDLNQCNASYDAIPEGRRSFTDIYRWSEKDGAYSAPTRNLDQAERAP